LPATAAWSITLPCYCVLLTVCCGYDTCNCCHACCMQDEAAAKAKGASAAVKGACSSSAVLSKCKFKGCKLTFASPLNQTHCLMSHLPSARTATAKVGAKLTSRCWLVSGWLNELWLLSHRGLLVQRGRALDMVLCVWHTSAHVHKGVRTLLTRAGHVQSASA
jgi:hypothetical protein